MTMRDLCSFTAVIVLAASQAVAETAAPPGPGPGPLTKQFPCDAFVKKDDGAWVPTRDVNVELPDRGVITVGPAASFMPGKAARGPDVGSIIEKACR
jgi:hypothetical protein